jgi:selenocysteine lyase/cysteine desulfurase
MTVILGLSRDEFPVTEKWIYLNHASTGPLPRRSVKAINDFLKEISECGDTVEEKWFKTVENTRKLAADLIGSSPDEVAITRSTSEGLFFIVFGLDWKPGDVILTAVGEFPANVYPWLSLIDKGVVVKFIPLEGNRLKFEDIERFLSERVRLVSLSFVEYLSGQRIDVVEIGRLLKERGIFFGVDAIQGLGCLEFNVKEAGVDFLSAGGSKWLLSPQGTGIFYLSEGLFELIKTSHLGWRSVRNFQDYMNYDPTPREDIRRFEYCTYNFSGIYGMEASLKLLLEVGIEKIERRVIHLTDLLEEKLRRKGYRIISPRERDEDKSGIVTFLPKNGDAEALAGLLREIHISVSARGGYIRVSPHFYNTEEEILKFVELLP